MTSILVGSYEILFYSAILSELWIGYCT